MEHCLSNFICSTTFSICIDNNGCVWSFGNNTHGNLGHKQGKIKKLFNNSNIISVPKKITSLSNIKIIDCGENHSIFCDFNGIIYGLGINKYGQLGTNKYYLTDNIISLPIIIDLPLINKIICGHNFTICLSDDGILYSFGYNSEGQLGIGRTKSFYEPQQIQNLNNVEDIVCGRAHIICKTNNDKYYAWGSGISGQLGNGNFKSSSKPIQCIRYPSNICDIKCNFDHSLILTFDGKVYGFGKNSYYQITSSNSYFNQPTLIENLPYIKKIEIGITHCFCIDINDNLWVYGGNLFNQLGLGKHENTVIAPLLHPTLSNIIDISHGGYHTFVKTIENKIYAFGNNTYSQLGLETHNIIQEIPIQVFQDNSDIWLTNICKSKAKSARK